MNIADYILIILIAIAFITALVYIFRQRKSGHCFGCGGGCKNCSSYHSCNQILNHSKKG